MSQLLLISLGPIQDFIATARRCQDLWFGSWLLSELSKTVARSARASGYVIFPAEQEDVGPDRRGVANKILVRLPASAAASSIAKQADEAMRARLQEIARAAWSGLPEPYFQRDTANLQLAELIEFTWVVVREGPGDDGYRDARAEAERRLAAVKNTRIWSQPAWHAFAGVGVPKSSLDGERESVIREDVFDWSPEERRRTFGTKRKERLCAMGLLKRLGSEADESLFRGPRPPFHSTAHVATIPVLEHLAEHPEAVTSYLEALSALGLRLDRFGLDERSVPTLLGYDGGLLVESRLRDHFDDYATEGPPNRVELATAALRGLLCSTGAPSPSPYYAYLLADGDRMGEVIDGLRTFGHHQTLAAALDAFSVECRNVVQRHHGTPIFAGGDDVLALLPLHRAVACARDLATTFVRVVQPVVEECWHSGERPAVSLSVGLAVTHSREPMGEARALAKAAEANAKQGTKNALAVHVSKRGGGALVARGRWDEDLPLDQRLVQWGQILADGALSSKTAHDLEHLAAQFDGAPGLDDRGPEIHSLARGVLARKRARGGGEDARIELQLARVDSIAALRALSHELRIAALLGAHTAQGGGA